MDTEATPPQDPPAEQREAEAPPLSPVVSRAEARLKKANELCERASRTDWVYLGVLGVLDVSSIYLDSQIAKYNDSVALRIGAPAFIGLAWGGTLGALPLLVSQCEWPGTPRIPGLEGGKHSELPLMIAMSVLSGATAPFVVGFETGPIPANWPVSERSGRLVAAGLGGAIGALVPYLLPPKPFRAIRELRDLDVQVSGSGVSLSVQF